MRYLTCPSYFVQRAISKEEAEGSCSIFPPKQEEEKVIAFPAVSK